MQLSPFIFLICLHLLAVGVELTLGGTVNPVSRCADVADFWCGTPLEHLAGIGVTSPEERTGLRAFVGALPGLGALGAAWDVAVSMINAVISAFIFDYAWLNGDWFIGQVVGLFLTLITVIWGVVVVVNVVITRNR